MPLRKDHLCLLRTPGQARSGQRLGLLRPEGSHHGVGFAHYFKEARNVDGRGAPGGGKFP